MPEIVDDPQYQQAIAGIKGQMTGGGASVAQRASPDEQEEYYDSIKEMLLQQGLEESAPKKKERGGVHNVLKFLPGYAQGLQERQKYDQKDEILNLEKQRQKGITADRQLKMRQQLDEIRTKREERQQRQQVGSALNQLSIGGMDPQATQELQGQVRQGLVGIGEEKAALDYGKPQGTPQEQAFREALRQGKSPLEAYQDVQAAGRAPQQPRAPTEASMALDAAGGDPDRALEILKTQRGAGSGSLEETRELQREKLQLDIEAKRRDAGGTLPPVDKEKFALDIRRNIRQEPSFKDFQAARSGYQAVVTGGRRNDSVGDLALINGLQRIIDPGVSVREGEFKTVAQAQGFLQRLFNSKEKFFEGDLLSTQYRQRVEYAGEIAREKVGTAREELQQVYGDSATVAGVDLGRLLPLELESQQGKASEANGAGDKTVTRQHVQKRLTPARKQAGWTLESLTKWYAEQGYKVQ